MDRMSVKGLAQVRERETPFGFSASELSKANLLRTFLPFHLSLFSASPSLAWQYRL